LSMRAGTNQMSASAPNARPAIHIPRQRRLNMTLSSSCHQASALDHTTDPAITVMVADQRP
jgi:hypothetical protein